MKIWMAGIDHSRADVTQRELFSFTKAGAAAALDVLSARYPQLGFLLLSTCNRTELWVSFRKEEEEALPVSPAHLLCALKEIPLDVGEPLLIQREGEQAVTHLLRLSCGMESRLFGEDQIISQVKDALGLAHSKGCTGTVLEKLFQCAVTAAKKVKSTVHLSARDSSAAGRAVELLRTHFGTLSGLPCLVIGNGEMGRLCAHALLKEGCEVSVTLRQYKTGDVLVPSGCRIVPYDQRLQALPHMRAVISATASPHHTLKYEDCRELLNDGVFRVLLDLAVPRDISSRLRDLPNLALYDIDAMGGGPGEDAALALQQAQEILDKALREWKSWYGFRGYTALVQQIGLKTGRDVLSRCEKTIRQSCQEQARPVLEKRVEQAARKSVEHLLYGLRESLPPALWEDCLRALSQSAEEKPS